MKASKLDPLASPEAEDQLMADPPVPEQIRDEDVLAALGKLPLEYREVVLMADVEEFSYKEIADALKIPLGTVMSRLSRGRRLLRLELAGVARAHGILPDNKAEGESA